MEATKANTELEGISEHAMQQYPLLHAKNTGR
jgi:hypothetical protein